VLAACSRQRRRQCDIYCLCFCLPVSDLEECFCINIIINVRRLHLDLVFCYKVVFSLVSVNLDDFFDLRSDSGTRGHAYISYLNHGVFVVNVWNSLSSVVQQSAVSCRVWNSLPSVVEFYTCPFGERCKVLIFRRLSNMANFIIIS